MSKRRSGDYKNRVRRNEKYKKRVYTILWREGSNNIENIEAESSFSTQGRKGHGFIDKASRKEYNQTRDENRLNDWKLDGE